MANIRIDTKQLTYTQFQVPGVTPATVDGTHAVLLSLEPGTYNFQQGSSADFDFRVTLDGTIDYDTRYDAFLSGRGSETLIVRGFPVALDSTQLSHGIVLNVFEAASLKPDRINQLMLVPASGYRFTSSVVNIDFTFGVETDGTLVVDPRFAGFAQVSGRTLTIKGYRITLDTQALSHGLQQDGISDWAGGDLSPGRHDITVAPVLMSSVGYQFLSAGGSVAVTLIVKADGTLVVEPPIAGWAQVSGQTLTIKGYRITLDTQALSHPLVPDGIVGWAGGDLSPGRHDITMVPSAGYQFVSFEFGVLSFDLEADGTIDSKWFTVEKQAGKTVLRVRIQGESTDPNVPAVSGTNGSSSGFLAGNDPQFHQQTGVYGQSDQQGVTGLTNVSNGTGVFGGGTTAADGRQIGVRGETVGGIGVQGKSSGSGLAGDFAGDVHVSGDLNCDGNITAKKISVSDAFFFGADCAEDFDIADAETVEPGMVMVIDKGGALRPCQEAYDRKVTGVVSGAGDHKPGIVLDKQTSTSKRLPIGLVGKVYCRVDAEHGPINVGDLLTTSSTAGHAMKADDPTRALGALIGKALQSLKNGRGLIPILIALK